MKQKIIYLFILILTSTILASNYLYYKPYYIQLVMILVLSFIAITIKNRISYEHKFYVYLIIFTIIFSVSLVLFVKYPTNEQEIKYRPVYKQPEKSIGSYSIQAYGNQYYKDDYFEGIISFGTQYIEIFNLLTNENNHLFLGGGTTYAQTPIRNVLYHEGYIYVMRETYPNSELLVIDIKTHETISTTKQMGRIAIFKLNHQVYVYDYNSIYQLSPNLEWTNEVKFISNAYHVAYESNNLFFFQRQVNGVYELLVYNLEFELIKSLTTSVSPLTLSENFNGDIFISVVEEENNRTDRYFYVYDQDLNIKSKQLIEENAEKDYTISLEEYDGKYFVKYYRIWDHYVYWYTEVYNKSFEKINVYKINIKFIFGDDNVYILQHDRNLLYELTENHFIDPYFTFTVKKPFYNILFVFAICIYPLLCIKRKETYKES